MSTNSSSGNQNGSSGASQLDEVVDEFFDSLTDRGLTRLVVGAATAGFLLAGAPVVLATGFFYGATILADRDPKWFKPKNS